MTIERYSFGSITINGKTYTSDVIVYPDRVDPSWWRKEGHYLRAEDLTVIMDSRPEVLVIGTGYSGVMTAPEETLMIVMSRGIEVRAEKTGKAVGLFNDLQKYKKVIAALHITC